jgi:hypothetical protein
LLMALLLLLLLLLVLLVLVLVLLQIPPLGYIPGHLGYSWVVATAAVVVGGHKSRQVLKHLVGNLLILGHLRLPIQLALLR